ncbi:polysaccharide pyruvyl transferase family protein [Shewanella sp. VB17]|uniref:polysaccharide pyruvyl transferase family protein n=1 Tax=Shewanella sp. VB17 TaxID=2739432 RepID=UPI001567AE15|nr:polysaccharide pyruvyl transferase family protein [Shewanella sp. VB17]NRD74680.1 polysaccharide pyruvyl transferase family protein [Shewanella sp. VB17]
MMIEIKGIQFINKGAELMLHAVLQQMKNYWPDSELVLAPNSNSSYLDRANVGAYQKLSIKKGKLDVNRLSYVIPDAIRGALKAKFGLVTEADIDVVLDASGFAYGDQWSALSIKLLANEIGRLTANGKKYVFLPQALGDFTRKQDIEYLKSALPKATLICARENSSFEHVANVIGRRNNLVQYPDFTNLLEGVVPDYYINGEKRILIIPNHNMIGIRNVHSEWKKSYVEVLISVVSVIRELGFEPVLLNHEGKKDANICHKVQQTAGEDIVLINEIDPLKVKGIIGMSKAVVCSRFHGCVSALSQGVPCLGTSWSHKYERLYEEYLQPDCLIYPHITAAEIKQVLATAIATVDEPEKSQAREHFKLQSQAMWAKVNQLIC